MGGLITKMAIVDALDGLMEQRPFDQVTVTDVCDRLSIARSTFYRHFRDIPGVAYWLWNEANSNGIYQEGKTLSCYDAHLKTFQELRRHRHFFSEAFKVVDYSSVTQYGGRSMERYLIDIYEYKAGVPMTEGQRLRVSFFSLGAKHATRHWGIDGMKEEPELMAQTFLESMPDFLIPHLEPDPTCTIEVAVER